MAGPNNSSATLIARGSIRANIGVGGGKGVTNDYNSLTNKPSINGKELVGNKTSRELGIPTVTANPSETTEMLSSIGINGVNYIIPGGGGTGEVYSVNGKVGHVMLDAEDVGALPNDTELFSGDYNDLENKPDIPSELADLEADAAHRTVTDEEKNNWNNKSDFSGDYNDLENKPDIPEVVANPENTTETLTSLGINGVNYALGGSGGGAVSSVNGKTGDVELNANDVGALPDDTPLFSGDYNDLDNKPNIPSTLSDLNEDATHRTVTDVEKAAWNAKSDFSGSYNDLEDKPTIPDELSDLSEDATHRTVTDVEKAAWNAKSDFSGDYNDLENKPDIPQNLSDLNEDTTHRVVTDAEKAAWNNKSDFSGDYNDLDNKPNIPSALADLSEDTTHRVVTDAEKAAWNNKSDFSGDYNDLENKPNIPTTTNDLTNNSGFITNNVSDLANYYLSFEVDGLISPLADDIEALETAFQDGCDIIEQAVIAKGQTPASNSPQDISDAIARIVSYQAPEEFDFNIGYVQNGSWIYEPAGLNYLDIYTCIGGHRYMIQLGNDVGTRFKVMTTTVDIRTITSGRVTGTKIVDIGDPPALRTAAFDVVEDGYIVIQKDNAGKTGIKTYCIDETLL